jgi:hypothetical protein
MLVETFQLSDWAPKADGSFPYFPFLCLKLRSPTLAKIHFQFSGTPGQWNLPT